METSNGKVTWKDLWEVNLQMDKKIDNLTEEVIKLKLRIAYIAGGLSVLVSIVINVIAKFI